MSKEYGKLTAEQFKGVIELLPEVRKQSTDLRTLVASVPKERLDELLVEDYNWSGVYEFTIYEHLALVAYALGMSAYVNEVAASPDPQQRMLVDFGDRSLIDTFELKAEAQHVIGLVFSVQRTILSVMLYQQSLSALVQEVRERDSNDALFKAVRVDRAVLAAPTIADRVARAELRRDERFFLHLRAALKGPSKKHWEAYQDLRYALATLRELGFDKLNDAQLERLMVDTLRVYPNTPSARKNLRAQYNHSKKLHTF